MTTTLTAPRHAVATTTLFTRYRVDIAFRNKIMGGIPKRADVIEGWLRSKAKVTDTDEIGEMTRRTLLELGVDLPHEATMEDMIAASKEIAAEKSTNGFKVDGELGLYIETRQIKAALKESTAILFPYTEEKWGSTRKAPRSYLAERVFIEGDVLPLGRREPDGIEMVIGHVTGPQGPKSTLTYHEYCCKPRLSFVMLSLRDSITPDQWQQILYHAAENGIGALRSQGHGRYDVLAVTRLKAGGPASIAITDED